MAVGLVQIDALLQPDKALHAQIVAQMLLDLRLAQVRVAVFIEQALGGGDAGAFAIDVDGAAFQDQGCLVAGKAVLIGHLTGDQLILAPWVVETALEAAPGVEAPIHGTAFTGRVDDHGRAGIAGPAVIAIHLNERDMGRHDGAGLGHKLGRHAHKHRGSRANGIGHLGKGGLGKTARLTPIIRAEGPNHPDRLLRCPLGGHKETVGGRQGVQKFAHYKSLTLAG